MKPENFTVVSAKMERYQKLDTIVKKLSSKGEEITVKVIVDGDVLMHIGAGPRFEHDAQGEAAKFIDELLGMYTEHMAFLRKELLPL